MTGAEATLDEFKKGIIRKRYLRCKQVCLIFHTIVSHVEYAASCYLAFYAPEEHFIYRYSEAEEFAKYIEFGKDLGAGVDFKLENYYELAEIVVNALKEHPSLIEKHDALFRDNDHYYYDKSLHLMAW